MRNLLLLPFILLVLSCNHSGKREDLKPGTPEALKDKSSLEITSNRGNGNLVDDLYSELVNKTPGLKQLEDSMANIRDSKADSLAAFVNFNNRNEGYYASSGKYLLLIKDSLLRREIKQLLDSSLTRYYASVAADTLLLESIEEKELALADMHLALKITRTLPLIEQYQKDNKPSIKSLRGYEKQVERSIKMADTLIGK